MKTKKFILYSVGALLVLGFVYGWTLGVFRNVIAEEKEAGGYKLAGMEYTGSYKKAGKYMADVGEKLKNAGIKSSKGFGIYYDDPQTTPDEKCRSYVGTVIEENDYDKIIQLKSLDFKIDSVARVPSVVVEFPMKSGLSYMIGAMKAYPAISKYINEKGYKASLALEIYDIPQKKILYIMQFNNNKNEFQLR